MNIIFLDVDGVLNCSSSRVFTKSGCQFIEDKYIERLKRIIDETSARVVLSSDWRLDREPPYDSDFLELKHKLLEYGISFCGFTPNYWTQERGFEIDQYLKTHYGITNFVILDDRSDMNPHKQRLVKTDPSVGLTDENVEEAIKILKGK